MRETRYLQEGEIKRGIQKRNWFVKEANAAAKLFQDAVEPCRNGLRDKSLWRKLLSMFRRQQTKTGMVDFSQLEPFELHNRYTLHKFFPAQVVTKYDEKRSTLRAVISYGGTPHFSSSRIDGYKFTAIVVFTDLRKNAVKTVVEQSAILSPQGKAGTFRCVGLGSPDGEIFYTLLKDRRIQRGQSASYNCDKRHEGYRRRKSRAAVDHSARTVISSEAGHHITNSIRVSGSCKDIQQNIISYTLL